jgi:hypothetical protein
VSVVITARFDGDITTLHHRFHPLPGHSSCAAGDFGSSLDVEYTLESSFLHLEHRPPFTGLAMDSYSAQLERTVDTAILTSGLKMSGSLSWPSPVYISIVNAEGLGKLLVLETVDSRNNT